MSAIWSAPNEKPPVHLSDRGHTILCALWLIVSAGLFAAVTVTGPGNGWVVAGIVSEAVGTCCYLMVAMRP